MVKLKLVSVEEGITALGFRRIASLARQLNPETQIYFIPVGNLYSFVSHIFPSTRKILSEKDLNAISGELSNSGLVGFSSMTPSSRYVELLAEITKQKNPNVFTLWGGTHCILSPDDAIKYVDAVCTGEGETSFQEFYHSFVSGADYLATHGMWFNTKQGILRNENSELIHSERLASFPHPFCDSDCKIYDFGLKAFRDFTKYDYVRYNGLSYRTIWSLGCPFSCSFCANSAFLSVDKNYGCIRYPSVDYVIEEIESAIKKYPFISTVTFNDDCFIGIPLTVLQEFSREYKKRINLPFVIFGLHPSLITEEKLELLAKTGMNRGRMGIQSGSDKLLRFYRRGTSLSKVKNSANLLAMISKKYDMIPPTYDVISDNPIETREDNLSSLRFFYELQRPYTLTLFSLRVFPKTYLSRYFASHPEIDTCDRSSSYLQTRGTVTNFLFYLLSIVRPPKFIFNGLLKYVKGYNEKQHFLPELCLLIRCIYFISRALPHFRKLDFTNIVGVWTYYLWKIGIRRRHTVGVHIQ